MLSINHNSSQSPFIGISSTSSRMRCHGPNEYIPSPPFLLFLHAVFLPTSRHMSHSNYGYFFFSKVWHDTRISKPTHDE